MKPEEQRIAIAEACGWRIENDAAGFFCIAPNDPEIGCNMECIPDYLHDLNAMHEAEKIFDDALYCRYINELCDVTIKGNNSMYMATAVQRAEAFLKTLNLWKHE
jgi:hypothetical protein